MPLDRMLRELRETVGSKAAAIVSRDGLVIAGDIPENVSRETFAIMCATILGAGTTAATELRVPPPTHIVLATKETRIHIVDAGPRALVVLVVPPSRDEAAIRTVLKPILEEIRQEVG
jgi:predicted regulator of Ras-like GTPase activity (Roadblock/LC7/MglB family)